MFFSGVGSVGGNKDNLKREKFNSYIIFEIVRRTDMLEATKAVRKSHLKLHLCIFGTGYDGGNEVIPPKLYIASFFLCISIIL